VRRAVAAASRTFEKDMKEAAAGAARDGAPAALRAPEVSYGGGYVIALDDSNLIINDMVWNGTVSFLLILGLYYFC